MRLTTSRSTERPTQPLCTVAIVVVSWLCNGPHFAALDARDVAHDDPCDSLKSAGDETLTHPYASEVSCSAIPTRQTGRPGAARFQGVPQAGRNGYGLQAADNIAPHAGSSAFRNQVAGMGLGRDGKWRGRKERAARRLGEGGKELPTGLRWGIIAPPSHAPPPSPARPFCGTPPHSGLRTKRPSKLVCCSGLSRYG